MIDKVIAFALGGVAGYFVGRYLTKNFYKEKAENEIADMEEYYQGKHPEKPPRETNAETVDGKKIFTMGGNYVKPTKVDYTSMYDPAESESPEEDDPVDIDDTDDGEALNNEYKANKSRAPRLIKGSEFGDQPGFTTQTLLYYTENETLVIHDMEDYGKDDMIYPDEYDDMLGDALVKFGFTTNDKEDRIYVRNFSRGCDFEIVKVFGAFEG